MATLSMALCKGSSWLNPTKTALECYENVDRPSSVRNTSSSSSAKQISLAHCGSWKREPTKPHNLQLRSQVNAVGHALFAIAGIQQARHSDFGNPTNASRLWKQSHHQREVLHSDYTTEENTLCCQSNTTGSRRLKNLKRNIFYDAGVALHSVLLLKRSLNPNPLPLTIPGSSSTKLKKWELGVGAGEDLPAKYKDDDPLKELPQRRCGILLHPTSLPGAHGIGDLGNGAYKFIDWLKETGCTVWQVLPLVPPGRRGGEDGSPYAGADANCGNTLLISLESLVRDGLLEKADLPAPEPVKRMNSAKVAAAKDPLIMKAAAKLVNTSSGKLKEKLEKFRSDPNISSWLEEAALFAALDQATKAKTWWTWPSHLRDRDPNAMKAARKEHQGFINNFVAAQFLFQRQWQALHKYANDAGIKILGDMPIYVGGHSADVWAHRSLFDLDAKTGAPSSVSGVPPDAFSATGQLWGSPLYNWKEMAKDKYSWWATRLRRAYELYDEFRIDHFRGFAGYWAVPASAQNAITGKWKAGPGKAFFTAMKEAVGKKLDIVAEDLGIITPDVVALRKDLHAPGMAVLQFAYSDNSRNPNLPHNHEPDQVVYPGTHDNDTCIGWWKKATDQEKARVKKYLRFTHEDHVHWEFIRAAMASVAKTAIIPMQDLLGLDNNARMNIPATQAGNWGWRVGEADVFQTLTKEQKRLRKLLCRYNRLTHEFAEQCTAECKDVDSTRKSKREQSPSIGSAIDKSLQTLAAMGKSILGQVAKPDSPKDKDKTKEKEKESKPFEKLKETLREKAEKLKDVAKEKLKDDAEKLKEKPSEKGKDKPGKEKSEERPSEKGKDKPGKEKSKEKPSGKGKDKPGKDEGKDNKKK
jgi:4-alpha-glucanotransferase